MCLSRLDHILTLQCIPLPGGEKLYKYAVSVTRSGAALGWIDEFR